MPISTIALAQILSARITALGAVPVVADLQREDAENLLWEQLLALLGDEASEVGNLFLFQGVESLIGVAGAAPIPNVNSLALDNSNFPIGTVVDVNLSGTFSNGSAGVVGYRAGARIGGADFFTDPFTVAAGSTAKFKVTVRVSRLDAVQSQMLDAISFVNGSIPPAFVVLPEPNPNLPVPFAEGDVLVPVGDMDTADPAADISLSAMTVSSALYSNIQ